MGQALPLGTAIRGTIAFFGVVILGNMVALLLLLLPGINLVAFFLVNGYLLGRNFSNSRPCAIAARKRRGFFRARHGTTVFLAELVLAAFLAVPLLNLLTPLFAAGMMVHLHKALTARDGARLIPSLADSDP